MSINDELKKHIDAIREIPATEDNLVTIKAINKTAQTIAIVTGLKLSDIYTEQDKKTAQERKLSFEYDREPFIELEKQKQQDESTNLV